jgi:hypothetical protein
MTWLHYLLAVSLIVGVWSQYPIVRHGFWWLIAWFFAGEPDDIDDLLQASRSVGETPGRSGLPPALLADRPGPIQGPLTNGRRQ